MGYVSSYVLRKLVYLSFSDVMSEEALAYIWHNLLSPQGEIVHHRRKIKHTHIECTI